MTEKYKPFENLYQMVINACIGTGHQPVRGDDCHCVLADESMETAEWPAELPRMDPHFRKIMLQCWEIYNRKGADYTIGQAEQDRLHNFRTAAEAAGITMMQAWYVYFYKHCAATAAYVKTGKVESEGIEGRLLDIINYAILGLKILEEQKQDAK